MMLRATNDTVANNPEKSTQHDRDEKCMRYCAVVVIAIALMAANVRADFHLQKKQTEPKSEAPATQRALHLPVELLDQKFRPKVSLEFTIRLTNVGTYPIWIHNHPLVQAGIKKPRELSDYTPRTLKALSLTQLKEIENMNEKHLIQSDIVPSRIRVVYEGSSRPLSQNKKDLISDWARRFAGAPETYTRPYEKEVAFTEDGERYWLAIRKEFVARFEQELKKGQTVDLFVIKLGSVRTPDQWEPVLLVEKFAKP